MKIIAYQNIILFSIIGIAMISTLLLAVDLLYCRYFIKRAVDMTEQLETKQNRVYLKGETRPFTGAAYQTVCGGECGIFGCALIHQYVHYSNGVLQGTAYLPKSGRADDFFSISLWGNYTRQHYNNGQPSE